MRAERTQSMISGNQAGAKQMPQGISSARAAGVDTATPEPAALHAGSALCGAAQTPVHSASSASPAGSACISRILRLAVKPP